MRNRRCRFKPHDIPQEVDFCPADMEAFDRLPAAFKWLLCNLMGQRLETELERRLADYPEALRAEVTKNIFRALGCYSPEETKAMNGGEPEDAPQ